MNTGFNFQQQGYAPRPQPMIQPARHDLKAPKRMSLEPSALSGFLPNREKLEKIKNRRSLMVNYPKGQIPPPQVLFGNLNHRGPTKNLPTITVNECGDLPAMNCHFTPLSPSPQRASPSPNRMNPSPQFDFRMNNSPQNYNNNKPLYNNNGPQPQQFYPIPNNNQQPNYHGYRSHSPQPPLNYSLHHNNFFSPYQKGENYNNHMKMNNSQGSQNVETMASYGPNNPSELEVPQNGPKQRVKSFDLTKEKKKENFKKTAAVSSPDKKKEPETVSLPDDDSFDENELLKECFNL